MVRIALALVLAACGAGRPTPKSVLSDYLKAEQLGRYEQAHARLAGVDQQARPLDAYIADHLSAGPMWLAVAARTRFDLGRAQTLEDGTVRVPVQAIHTELRILADTMPPPDPSVVETSPDPTAAMREHIDRYLDSHPLPEVAEPLTYALREEAGSWRVWLGLAQQDAAIEAIRAARVLADADAKSPEARTAWEAVLALPPDPSGVVVAVQAEARKELDALGPQ